MVRSMGRSLPVLVAILALLLPSTAARAVEIHPFYARHFSPLVQAFGLPPAEDGDTAPAGTVLSRLVVDAANSYHGGAGPRQSSSLDGETWRTTLALRYGVGPRLEAGIDVPVVNHSGGFLDGFIESFHRAIGKPKNDGAGNPRDRFGYAYSRDGTAIVALTNDTWALGDIMLSGAWRLSSPADSGRPTALRATLKLPTGKEADLAGSGGTEGSLRIAVLDPKTFARWNTTLFASAGALYIGSDTFLGDLRRPIVGFGTVGAGWTPASWVALKLQADGHTAISRESGFKPLSWTVHVMGGFTFALPHGVEMDLGISENILNETAPDVGFQLGFRKRFGG
jgi:hypothetical protein